MNKPLNLSVLILGLMFLLLPVDMINGMLLKNDINLPLSLGQLYKLVIIFFLFLSFTLKPIKLINSLFIFLILLIPSFFQVLAQFKFGFLLGDSIKIMRYLTPLFCYMFFVDLIKADSDKYIALIFKLVKFSFVIFSINILLKYVGLGYPMYSYNSVGSKGFFFAGNETSVVLIILSSILAYKLWLEHEVKKYIFLFVFTLFIGLTISSKTGILGVLLTFLLIPLKPLSTKVSFKRLKIITGSLFLTIIGYLIIITESIQNTPAFLRINFFLRKLDFITFIFSHRNYFFKDAMGVYLKKYSFIEKIIGVGQTKYEILNGDSIVEIDIADIFFAYGILGLFLFCFFISVIWLQVQRLKKTNNNPYAGFVFLMLIILLGISTIAGHVFSSGMAAVFIGLLFSLMYIKKEQIAKE